MTGQEILTALDKLHEVKQACKGMKLETVTQYRGYYYAVDAYVKQGYKKTEAITWVSDDFGVSEDTVYRALRFFAIPCKNI